MLELAFEPESLHFRRWVLHCALRCHIVDYIQKLFHTFTSGQTLLFFHSIAPGVTVQAVAQLKPEGVEAHFIVAACENMVSEKAMRPGDILTASNGKTIEVRYLMSQITNDSASCRYFCLVCAKRHSSTRSMLLQQLLGSNGSRG